MALAQSLLEAWKVLELRPLASGREDGPTSAAEDPNFYVPLPPASTEGLRLPTPIEKIQRRLLAGSRETKLFLSGHVGSGKSTELGRLADDEEIRARFCVITLRFEEQEWAMLESSQVLFRVAGALFERGLAKDRLSESGDWLKKLKAVNSQLFGAAGVQVKEAGLKAEYNLLFVKLTQELKFSEELRRQFRDLGETLKSTLRDLLTAMTDDFEDNLARNEEPAELLVIVDDLDKVRGAANQKDIFETNLNELLAMPFRAVYTLPMGVAFGANRADVRQNREHLYPIKVLSKVGGLDPEAAYLRDRIGFFHSIVNRRVAPNLIEDEAIRLAALYSGGVLREFLRLLRDAIDLARFNKSDVLDSLTMKVALGEERRRESAGLNAPDFDALATIHGKHRLRSDDDRRYLDESRILECYNDQDWFEVNPLLWKLLPEPLNSDDAE